MAKTQLAQTNANAEFAEAREQFEQLQEQMDDQDVYVVADPTVIGTIDAIEEAVRDTERLAEAIIWKLKGPRAQEITSGTPDCDSIEAWLGAIHSKLKSINDDLRASAHTIGA